MTDAAALPPSSSLPPVSGASSTAGVTGVGPASGLSRVAQVGQVVAAAQAALASAVNLSPQAQQGIRAEAFSQLVSSLVQHLPTASVELPSSWPTTGVGAALQNLLSSLVQGSTAAQALPQQLVTVQAWPQSLLQAVLQQAGQAAGAGTNSPLPQAASAAALLGLPNTGITESARQPAAALGGNAQALVDTASPQAASNSAPAVRLQIPALQTWLVLQGQIQAQDGTRSFSMTLRVPQAWAQAQAALSAALPRSSLASADAPTPGTAPSTPGLATPAAAMNLSGLQLNFAGTMQQLSRTAFGIVLQPQALPGSTQAAQAQLQALRTSAILQLEMQPLPTQAAQQSVQAAAAFSPAQMLTQEWQALLQTRPTDPWLLMAQQQAGGQQPRQSTYAGEEGGICTVLGCQYMGRAICAQPFCAEMNYLWAVARLQGRST